MQLNREMNNRSINQINLYSLPYFQCQQLFAYKKTCSTHVQYQIYLLDNILLEPLIQMNMIFTELNISNKYKLQAFCSLREQ